MSACRLASRVRKLQEKEKKEEKKEKKQKKGPWSNGTTLRETTAGSIG
jgi:hypothetical protein